MGREAICQCGVDGVEHSVKALLESKVLILRGEFKRSIAFADITSVTVTGARLEFLVAAEKFSLALGAEEAKRWQSTLTRAPATLADKLGLKGDAKVYVIGSIEDEALREAVAGRQTSAAAEAAVGIAMTLTSQQLEAALAIHQKLSALPLWIAHPKGKKTVLSESMVRDTMRARGYMDTKVSAVSDQLTATRYNRQSS